VNIHNTHRDSHSYKHLFKGYVCFTQQHSLIHTHTHTHTHTHKSKKVSRMNHLKKEKKKKKRKSRVHFPYLLPFITGRYIDGP